jgi:hypothetical protein
MKTDGWQTQSDTKVHLTFWNLSFYTVCSFKDINLKQVTASPSKFPILLWRLYISFTFHTADLKKFVVYLTARACFEETCVPDVKIFDGTQIPQPVCDLYADFSMKGKRYI